jgi:hypothetical protein
VGLAEPLSRDRDRDLFAYSLHRIVVNRAIHDRMEVLATEMAAATNLVDDPTTVNDQTTIAVE